MPYINTIDINGVVYTLENLTDGNNIVTLPELSRDDIFVLQGNIVNNTSSTSTTQPLSANQGRVLRNDLNAEIQNRINDVNLEEERATEAERILTENLNKEISDREADVNAEETRATNAENTLTTNLNAEISRAKKAEADELARAQAAEKTLTDNLASEVTRATNKENEINTALTNEVARATGAENGLASRIATMEAFFKEADIDASKDFIDTLKEIQGYIASDKTGASAMTYSIQTNTNDISNLTQTKVDKVDGMGLSSNDYTDAEKTKLSGIASGANKYVHPTYTAHESGLYKITVDAFGHVSATDTVSKDDIVTLGVPAQDTTYGVATSDTDGLLSAEDKQKYDGYDGRISAIVGTFDPPVDYIVEQGKSGSWTYRKWNSGVAECWGTLSGTLAPTENASGLSGLSVFSGSVAFPTDLFVDIPSVTYNCRIGDGYSFPADAETSTITHFNWTALSTVGTGYSECAIAAKASGLWK